MCIFEYYLGNSSLIILHNNASWSCTASPFYSCVRYDNFEIWDSVEIATGTVDLIWKKKEVDYVYNAQILQISAFEEKNNMSSKLSNPNAAPGSAA